MPSGSCHDPSDSLNQRFHKDPGNFLVFLRQLFLERVDAGHLAGGKFQVQWTAVTVGGIDWHGRKEEGAKPFVKEFYSTYAHRSHGVSMISQGQPNEFPFGSGWRLSLLPVLHGDFEGDLDGGRPVI